MNKEIIRESQTLPLLTLNQLVDKEIADMKEAGAAKTPVAKQETWLNAKHESWSMEDASSSDILHVDNCWFKVELELGECANGAKKSLTDTAAGIKNYFEREDGFLQAGFSAAFFTEASNTVASAAATAMDTMISLRNKLDEAVLWFAEEFVKEYVVKEASLKKAKKKESFTGTAERIQNYFEGEGGFFQAGFRSPFFTQASKKVATAAVTVMDRMISLSNKLDEAVTDMDTMISLNKKMDEVILQVMEETRDVVKEASLTKDKKSDKADSKDKNVKKSDNGEKDKKSNKGKAVKNSDEEKSIDKKIDDTCKSIDKKTGVNRSKDKNRVKAKSTDTI